MRILIAIDSSDASDVVVSTVIGQVKPAGTRVELLHILDPFPERLARKKGGRDFPDFAAARKDLRVFAEKLLASAEGRLQAAGFSVSSSIQEGDVRTLILEQAKAWCADLIILGAPSQRGVKRFFSSSVSEYVSSEALCSVEIVRIAKNTESVPSVEPLGMLRSQGADRTDASSSSDAAGP